MPYHWGTGSENRDLSDEVPPMLVAEGLAAVYRRYAEDRHLYELEARARDQQLGFWSTNYRPRGAGGS